MAIRDYDAENKDNLGRKYNYEFDVVSREIFLETIAHHIDSNPTAKTLEVGSYDGSMTKLILKYVTKISVIEPSAELAQRVANIDPENISVSVSTVEDFRTKEKFDNIFLVHTLEHVENPKVVLQKLKSLLSREGKLFIMVPNGNALSRQIAVAMGLITHNAAVTESEFMQGHLRTYTLDTFESEVRDAGLMSIETGGIILKALANFQLDEGMANGTISLEYLKGANKLARKYPDFAASIYQVCAL
jgi:2-polyprenyl-3-methyl-5-hydroxy-6-metoxy-1,4-benzoquinol methylase